MAGLFDHAAGQAAGAVTENEFLAAPDAPHGRGVEAFVTLDDSQVSDVGQRVDVEQAGQLAPGKGLTQPAEQSAGGGGMRRPDFGHVPVATAFELA